MPTTLTEYTSFTGPVSVPVNSDPRTAASVDDAFQALTDRTRFLLSGSSGRILWNERIRVGAATTGLGVYVGAIKSLVIGEALLSLAPVGGESELAGSLPLANSSWYGIYASDDGSGGLLLGASLDGRDVTGVWKSTGIGTHRYLGSFRTDGSGNPIALEGVAGHYRWMTAPAARTALATGSSTSAASVACAAYAPPHARLLCLSTLLHETGGAGNGQGSLGQTTSGAVLAQLRSPTSGNATQSLDLPCTSAQAISYSVVSATELTIYVDGWRE